MRGLKISFYLLSAMMIGVSCSDDNDQENLGKTASLTVSIKGQPTLRSIGSSETNPAVESKVSNFTVFVFNNNSGDLEASKSFTFAENQLVGEIENLSTGTSKKIVALVNVPTDLNTASIETYSSLQNNLVTLQSQNIATLEETGLLMSGETTDAYTLAEGNNTVSIPVSRRVAKIVLKSVIVNPGSANITNFLLDSVSIQKARVNGTPLGVVQTIENEVANFAGGIASPAGANPNFSTTYAFLSENLPAFKTGENIITTENDERYFYVLPNDGANNNPTMLTLSGVYGTNSANAYFPIVINGENGSGSTDGTFIKSNQVYEISVVINHPNSPSEDPNVLPSTGVLDVTIVPLDWESHIEQNVEW